jgi:hypothetical protein
LESVYWYVAQNDDDTIRVVVKDKWKMDVK